MAKTAKSASKKPAKKAAKKVTAKKAVAKTTAKKATVKTVSKKNAVDNSRKKVVGKTTKAGKPKSNGRRAVQKEKIYDLLTRKNGCLVEDILRVTGWPSVSVPQMAKACGLNLRKEAEEKGKNPRRGRARNRYYGTPL